MKGGANMAKSAVNKSHKGRQKMHYEKTGKYKRQLRRSLTRKIHKLEMYLLNNPKDEQNKQDIPVAIKKYSMMY